MTSVTVQERFDHPIEEVWALVSDFGGIAKYLKGIEGCTLEGEGLGSERTIAMGGDEIVERLTWFDPADHALSYTILSGPLPFARYVATMRLSPDGQGCVLTWQSNFEPAGVSADEASAFAEGIYRGGIKGYEQTLAR